MNHNARTGSPRRKSHSREVWEARMAGEQTAADKVLNKIWGAGKYWTPLDLFTRSCR